jgi:hypothetical protein
LSKKFIFGIVIIAFFIPAFFIYGLYFVVLNSSWLSILKIPNIAFDTNNKITMTNYISMYISILGIEITAALTWVIHRYSALKKNAEDEEKLRLCRDKVYNFLMNSLKYYFSIYLHDLFHDNVFVWPVNYYNINDDLLYLKLDEKYVCIYKDLTNKFGIVKSEQEKGKSISRYLTELFKEISKDFYNYYKCELGREISIDLILKNTYMEALNQLTETKISVSKTVRYANGQIFYTERDGKYLVYNNAGREICHCTFKKSAPYQGTAHLYKNGKTYFYGDINGNIKGDGLFYYCKVSDDDEIVFDENNEPFIVDNFRLSTGDIESSRDNSKPCKVANVIYKNRNYIIDKSTIQSGRYFEFG